MSGAKPYIDYMGREWHHRENFINFVMQNVGERNWGYLRYGAARALVEEIRLKDREIERLHREHERFRREVAHAVRDIAEQRDSLAERLMK